MTTGEIAVIDTVLSWSAIVAVVAVLVSLVVAVVTLMHGRRRQGDKIAHIERDVEIERKKAVHKNRQMRRVVASVVKELGFDSAKTFSAVEFTGDAWPEFARGAFLDGSFRSVLRTKADGTNPPLRMEVESLKRDLARARCDHAFDVCGKCGEKRVKENDEDPDSSST